MASSKSQPTTPTEKGSLLRRGSHSKKALKEKIVQIYEAFFRVGCLHTALFYTIQDALKMCTTNAVL